MLQRNKTQASWETFTNVTYAEMCCKYRNTLAVFFFCICLFFVYLVTCPVFAVCIVFAAHFLMLYSFCNSYICMNSAVWCCVSLYCRPSACVVGHHHICRHCIGWLPCVYYVFDCFYCACFYCVCSTLCPHCKPISLDQSIRCVFFVCLCFVCLHLCWAVVV